MIARAPGRVLPSATLGQRSFSECRVFTRDGLESTRTTQLDPSGELFGHDKVEGVATTDGGKTLYLSNDDDFGVDTIAVDPDGTWTVHQKVLPATGQPDNGEILKIDTTKLPAVLKTVTVTIHVH